MPTDEEILNNKPASPRTCPECKTVFTPKNPYSTMAKMREYCSTACANAKHKRTKQGIRFDDRPEAEKEKAYRYGYL